MLRKTSIIICGLLALGLTGHAGAVNVIQFKSYESSGNPGYLNYRAYTDAASGDIEVHIGTEDGTAANYTLQIVDGASAGSIEIVTPAEAARLRHDSTPATYNDWNTTGWTPDGFCPYYVVVTLTGVNNTKVNFRIYDSRPEGGGFVRRRGRRRFGKDYRGRDFG